MSNTNTNILPKLLAQGLLALRQQSIMTRLVNTSYSDMAAQKGAVINIPIPSAVTVTNVTPSALPATNQDIAPTVALVTLDFWKEGTFYMTDSDAVSVMDGVIPMQASEAIKGLANAVDSYIFGKTTGIFGYAGVAGTTPFNTSLNIAASARMLLNSQLAPLSDRRGVIDPAAEMNFLLNTNILQTEQRGDSAGIIEGSIGRKLGLDWYMDQNVTTYTPGTGWVTGFSSTAGATISANTLTVLNATASGTIKVGDIFTVTGSTQQYVVTAAAAASATVTVALAIYPELKATVTAGAALTVLATAYTMNLAFHRDAFAWASRPLSSIGGYGNEFSSAVDPISGIALRLEVSRQHKQTTFAFDILGGANLIRPELAVKILG